MAARVGGRLLFLKQQQYGKLLYNNNKSCSSPLVVSVAAPLLHSVLESQEESIPAGLLRAASQLSQGGAWYTQRSAVGEDTDSHDDFRPVHRESVSVPSVYELIEQDIQENPVMVYMKGVPGAPQCGFSSMVCKVLDSYEVKYKSRDVLADQELREGIKSFSNWPTIPQVYVDGEFLGGSDILMSMHRSGELGNKLKHLRNHS
ncbi:unnamed protein product [Sphagnum balticum]